ncbi:MAG: hypothetical protein Q9159_001103 [Coniocarpon cinnabarinum]
MARKVPRSICLFLDFDSTLTKNDTLSALATHVGYARNSNNNVPPWSHFYESYTNHKRDLDEVYADKPPQTRMENAIAYQRRLRIVEEASHQRVMNAGIFNDITVKDVEKGAWTALESQDVELRDGAIDLMKSISMLDANTTQSPVERMVAILSVNWSAEWIRQILTAATDSHFLMTHSIVVEANELPRLGGTWPNLCTSDQKLHVMQEYCKGRSEYLKVYIGDSLTDVECLLDADVGVMIRDEPLRSGQRALKELLQDARRAVPHVSEWRTRLPSTSNQLFWTYTLKEVESLLREYVHFLPTETGS